MKQSQSTTNKERKIELSLAPLNYNADENVNFNSKYVDTTYLREIFTSNNYSAIIWKDGYRLAENFISAAGFFPDIDHNMSVEKAEEILSTKNLNYALITTKSHTLAEDRFRLFIPFSHKLFTLDRYQQAAYSINDLFEGKIDPKVFDGARFLFGSPDEAYYSQNWNGKDFDVKGISKYNLASVDAYSGDWDDNLLVVDSKGQEISVKNIDKKMPIHCPFHDDESPSAFIGFSDRSNNWYISCSSCNETFWKARIRVPLEKRLSRYWSHSSNIYEAGISGENFYFKEIGKEKYFT